MDPTCHCLAPPLLLPPLGTPTIARCCFGGGAGGLRTVFLVPAALARAYHEASTGEPSTTSRSSSILAPRVLATIRDDELLTAHADELLTAHAGLGGYRVRDLPDGLVSGDFNFVISLLLHRLAHRVPKRATTVALNTFPGLDPPGRAAALAAELPNCLPLGPYHLL